MKKVVLGLVVVFLGFWLVNDPGGLADKASDAGGQGWSIAEDLFGSTITFLDEL